MRTVILMCGTGASSGFMASKTRKSIKALGVDIEVFARSDSEVEDVLDTANMILIGPHLQFIENDIKDSVKRANKEIKVGVIPQKIYGNLDGEALVKFILENFEEEK